MVHVHVVATKLVQQFMIKEYWNMKDFISDI